MADAGAAETALGVGDGGPNFEIAGQPGASLVHQQVDRLVQDIERHAFADRLTQPGHAGFPKTFGQRHGIGADGGGHLAVQRTGRSPPKYGYEHDRGQHEDDGEQRREAQRGTLQQPWRGGARRAALGQGSARIM